MSTCWWVCKYMLVGVSVHASGCVSTCWWMCKHVMVGVSVHVSLSVSMCLFVSVYVRVCEEGLYRCWCSYTHIYDCVCVYIIGP